MMIGDKYIQANKSTGYISATSGKNTAKVETSKATPKEKIKSINIENGSNKIESPNLTFEKAIMINNGTNDKKKFTKLARTVETTNEVLGR